MVEKTEPKTLYVSDLDGTLMRNDETLSENTVRIINGLVERGLDFTYATARSVESARPIAGGLKLKLPVVTRNGAVLADNATGKHIRKAVFTDEEVALLKALLTDIPYCGYVSCFIGEEMIRTTMEGRHSVGLQGYLDYYKGDPTMKYMDSYDEMFCGLPGYVTCIGEKEEIEPIYDRVRAHDCWEVLFQKDTYRDEYWLEICPKNCTKAKSLLKLKEDYGFDRLVVFGDSLNDVSMFKIADEAYAVANARDELKKLATKVIGYNEEDAVAHFLEKVMDAGKEQMIVQLCKDEKWLLSEDAFRIYSACMYKPTFDAYCKEMKVLLSDKKIYVCKVDATIKGMLVLDKEKAEIVGIAIDPNFRKKGIGRYLVEEVMRQEDLKSLYAQTDDDAVLFYQKCGFEVKRIIKEYPDGKVVRYDCMKKLGE